MQPKSLASRTESGFEWRWVWTFPAFAVSTFPLMVLHGTLNRLAVDQPLPQQIAWQTADSAVVASIAAVQGTIGWVTYRDVRDAKV